MSSELYTPLKKDDQTTRKAVLIFIQRFRNRREAIEQRLKRVVDEEESLSQLPVQIDDTVIKRSATLRGLLKDLDRNICAVDEHQICAVDEHLGEQ